MKVSGVWIALVCNHVFSSKYEDEQDDSLEEGLTQDVLNHLLRNDVLLLSVWRSFQEVCLWLLSGKSEGGKRVHDQVYPEKLDGLERRVPHHDRANEGHDQSYHIHSKLKLKESSDVIIYVSTPHASLNNGSEVVILNDNISGRVSNLSSGLHSETDISFFEGRGIVGSITSDSDDISELSQTSNHNVLVIWS